MVKIFSKERISDEWLEKMFGNVGWVYRKEVCLVLLVVYRVLTECMRTSGTHIRFYHLRPSCRSEARSRILLPESIRTASSAIFLMLVVLIEIALQVHLHNGNRDHRFPECGRPSPA